jgi:hypothetical protein
MASSKLFSRIFLEEVSKTMLDDSQYIFHQLLSGRTNLWRRDGWARGPHGEPKKYTKTILAAIELPEECKRGLNEK